MTNLSVAVLTGGHSVHVRPFVDFWNGLEGIDAYVQHFEQWLTAAGNDSFTAEGHRISRPDLYGDRGVVEPPGDDQDQRDSYDVTLFYTMLRDARSPKAQSSLERMFETGMPIFVMHHALLNFMTDDYWAEVIGLPDRDISIDQIYEETYPIEVNAQHAAAGGLADFSIQDEVYGIGDCDDSCDVLLTTENPHSMRTLAWTTTHGNSRVFCSQLGHDPRTWYNPAFATLVRNGLQWCAGVPVGSPD